jgi:hypothetical protein
MVSILTFIVLGQRTNVVAEWLALLLRFREVSGSYPGPDTGYPDTFFVVILIPPGRCQDSTLN